MKPTRRFGGQEGVVSSDLEALSRESASRLSFQAFDTSRLAPVVRVAPTAAMSSNRSMGCRTGQPVSNLGVLAAADAPLPPCISPMSFSATCGVSAWEVRNLSSR